MEIDDPAPDPLDTMHDHIRYLGDGAFVCRSDGDAWIYTTNGNGETVTARIALGPAELLRLQDWIAQIFARRA